MTDVLVSVTMKRKDVEVASHGFSIFLDPKRAKLQDAEVAVMMEEEEALADADASPAHVQPTMFMPPVLPAQGQEALNDCTISTASGSKSSESRADQAEPMDVEVDLQQCSTLKQQQHTPFFSGFF